MEIKERLVVGYFFRVIWAHTRAVTSLAQFDHGEGDRPLVNKKNLEPRCWTHCTGGLDSSLVILNSTSRKSMRYERHFEQINCVWSTASPPSTIRPKLGSVFLSQDLQKYPGPKNQGRDGVMSMRYWDPKVLIYSFKVKDKIYLLLNLVD